MAETKLFVLFAKHNAEANGNIVGILEKLSNDEREKERGSYYHSLSGLVRHLLSGTIFFGSLFTKALAGNPAASRALADITAVPHAPQGALSQAQWEQTAQALGKADAAYVALTQALREDDLAALIELDWYGGNPAAVPLSFMLQQLISHHIHHRGQISQILDELKIDNDYSGISAAFL